MEGLREMDIAARAMVNAVCDAVMTAVTVITGTAVTTVTAVSTVTTVVITTASRCGPPS